MEFLLNMPATIKVIASLVIILVINRLTKQLLISILAGTLVLGFWSGHSPLAVGGIAWERVSSMNNIMLMAAIYLVIVLSKQMSETGVMKDMVILVKKRVSKRMSMAILPAVIGFLPMPGGALFSAPMVDDCDNNDETDPLFKAKINYWFRHVWEYWWPLYPGVLLAAEISGLELWQIIILQFPLCLLSCLAGYFFLLRKIKEEKRAREKTKIFKEFLKLISPILIIILGYLVIKFGIPAAGRWNRYLPIVIGILLAIILLQVQRPLDANGWRKIIMTKKTLSLILLVVIVRIYGAFIEARLPGGQFFGEYMNRELTGIGFPLIITITLIPFICGMVTGVAVGFVGASFPIVVSLLGPAPGLGLLLGTTVLAYGFGYMGIILSPVHVCLIVTNEYFKTRIGGIITRLIRPALVIMAGAAGISFLVRLIPF